MPDKIEKYFFQFFSMKTDECFLKFAKYKAFIQIKIS